MNASAVHEIARRRRRSSESLQAEIGRLVAERQELRARGATEAQLERNRKRIAKLQRELAVALIERHAPKASAA